MKLILLVAILAISGKRPPRVWRVSMKRQVPSYVRSLRKENVFMVRTKITNTKSFLFGLIKIVEEKERSVR